MKKPIGEALGETIRRLRAERAWSLDYLGEICGTSAANISKIEHGRPREYRLELLRKLAAAFGLGLYELFALAEDVELTGKEHLAADETQLLGVYRRLMPAQRDTLRSVARNLSPPAV